MHGAPSVSYPVGRSLFAAVLLSMVWLLGALLNAWWGYQSQHFSWRLWTSWFVLAAAGAFAAWSWWRCPRGILAWDGEKSWCFTGEGGAGTGTLEVSLDLQHWLLLRWKGAGLSHWFWLAHTRFPERWDDVRRAVYSRAGPEALPQVRAPAAKP